MSSELLSFLDLHPYIRSTVADKARGVVFGGAVGDAVGLYTEFFPKTQAQELYAHSSISFIDPVTPLHGDNHRDRFQACGWTDDTDNAIMILLSYLHTDGKLDVLDFTRRLRSWCSGQGLRCLDRLPLGIGKTVSSVVGSYGYEADPKKAAKDVWQRSGYRMAPNGSLMRANILGVICVNETLEETWKIAAEFSLVSHYDPRCVVSCCVYVALIRGVLRNEITTERDADALLETTWMWVCTQQKELWADQELDNAEYRKHTEAKAFDDLKLDDAREMGYVYKALGCAIIVLRRALNAPENPVEDMFGDLIMEVVLEGGDADTNACIAGGLLGAIFGYKGLTPRWRDGLAHRQWLMNKTTGLLQIVGIISGDYHGSEDPDTSLDGGKGFLSKKEMDARESQLVTMLMTRMSERKGIKMPGKKDRKSFWGSLTG